MNLAEISRLDCTMFHVKHFKFFCCEGLGNMLFYVADKKLYIHFKQHLINKILCHAIQLGMQVIYQKDYRALACFINYFQYCQQ